MAVGSRGAFSLVLLLFLEALVEAEGKAIQQEEEAGLVSCEDRAGWFSCRQDADNCISRSQVGILLKLLRWVFEDYFGRHSDLCQHENKFLGRQVTAHVVLRRLNVDLCRHRSSRLIFKNPPLGFFLNKSRFAIVKWIESLFASHNKINFAISIIVIGTI